MAKIMKVYSLIVFPSINFIEIKGGSPGKNKAKNGFILER